MIKKERFITLGGNRYLCDPCSGKWFSYQGSYGNQLKFIPFEGQTYTDRLSALRKRIILEENGEEIFSKIFTFNRLFAREGLPELLYEITNHVFDLYLV